MSSRSPPATSVVQESQHTSMSLSTSHLLLVSYSKDIYVLWLSGITLIVFVVVHNSTELYQNECVFIFFILIFSSHFK